jgi:hypothetical protein
MKEKSIIKTHKLMATVNKINTLQDTLGALSHSNSAASVFAEFNKINSLQDTLGALSHSNSAASVFAEFNKINSLQDTLGALSHSNSAASVFAKINKINSLQDTLGALSHSNSAASVFAKINKINSLQDTLGALSHSNSAASVFAEFNKINSLQDTLGSIYAKSMFDSINQTNPMLEILDSMKHSNPMDKMIHGWASTLTKEYKNPFKGAAESIKALNTIHREASKYIESESEIVVNANNTITLNATTLSYEELNSFVNSITEKTFSVKLQNQEKIIESLFDQIRALKNPPLQQLLYNFYLPVILFLMSLFLSPLVNFYATNYLNNNDKAIKRQMVKEVVKQVDSTSLNYYRYVNARVLNTHQNPKALSPIIGKLYLASLVIVIEQQKDWSLIIWTDPSTGVSVKGWVFTRYLMKFK